MKSSLIIAAFGILLMSGCASVPMESEQMSNQAKQFSPPQTNKAGIYVYREDTVVGAALKKDVWIDKECVGETAKGVFFYHEVDGGARHTISTESEFSPNDLSLDTVRGKLYFIEQFIKMGLFVGGAGLREVDAETGKKEISSLKLAKKGHCNSGK